MMPSVRRDALTGADTAGRPAFLPRLSRIRDRKFRRSVGILPRLLAADETSSEHGASRSRRVCARVRLARQKAFVWVAAAIEAVAEASDRV